MELTGGTAWGSSPGNRRSWMLRQALRPVMLWRGQEGSFTVVSLRPLEPAGGGTKTKLQPLEVLSFHHQEKCI